MTTILNTTRFNAPTVTAVPSTAQTALLTTPAQTTASHAPTAYVNIHCSKSYSLAEAAGVGIAAGVVVASIIILAFIFIRRRQTRTRKISPTISPNVLVTGPMNHNGDEWEKYREGSKDVIVEGNGSLKYKEPPTYTKSV
jgi:hypothetical protein